MISLGKGWKVYCCKKKNLWEKKIDSIGVIERLVWKIALRRGLGLDFPFISMF